MAIVTTGIVKGREVKMYFAGTVLDDQLDMSLEVSADLLESTTKSGSGNWKEYLHNLQGATGSVNGYYSMDADNGHSEALAALAAGDPIAFIMKSGSVGDTQHAFSAFVNSVSLGLPLTGLGTYSISFTVTGAVTESATAS